MKNKLSRIILVLLFLTVISFFFGGHMVYATYTLSITSTMSAGGNATLTWSGLPDQTHTGYQGIGLFTGNAPSAVGKTSGTLKYTEYLPTSSSGQTCGTALAGVNVPTSGSCYFVLSPSTSAGTYHLEAGGNGMSGIYSSALSNNFTVTAAYVTLSVPSTVQAGSNISVSWTIQSSYASNSQYQGFNLMSGGLNSTFPYSKTSGYLVSPNVGGYMTSSGSGTCATTSPGTAHSSGTCSLLIPSSTTVGTYHFEIPSGLSGGFINTASNAFTITPSPNTVVPDVSNSFTPGSMVTGTWTIQSGSLTSGCPYNGLCDYIFIVNNADNPTNYMTAGTQIEWGAAVSGNTGLTSGTFSFPALDNVGRNPIPTGVYKLEYIRWTDSSYDFSVLATSDPFSIVINPPTLTTTAVTALTPVSATSGGNITSDGGSAITAMGLVYGTNSAVLPTVGAPGYINAFRCSTLSDCSIITNPFSQAMGNLTSGTTYYVRAFAKNSTGTYSYGGATSVQFTTPVMSGTLTAPNCTVPADASSCTTTLTWTVTNPDNPGGSAVTSSIDNSGNSHPNFTIAPPVTTGTADVGTKSGVFVPLTGRTFYLYNYSISLVPTPPSGSGLVVVPTCITGTSPYGGVCRAPVNGGWSGWSDPGGFSDGAGGTCSLACGGGTQSRTCTNPAPLYGGTTCSGTTSQSCNTQSCSSPGACSSPAVHYACATGSTSGSHVSSPSKWTWTCTGSGTGGTTVSCSEKKTPGYNEY